MTSCCTHIALGIRPVPVTKDVHSVFSPSLTFRQPANFATNSYLLLTRGKQETVFANVRAHAQITRRRVVISSVEGDTVS